ncbi:uncharacterized protein LOC124209851 isoform X1 [Daphnia pulex]|uniref:uncharacterized protein LOC124209851 isoform X1 n=1 Tax=Daphnia pulex TaxID=6669 RepID=UPI001EDCD77A|nr:uncharacterized protein LOC124209851 isoform X1 [Daphnia pulex]
MPSTMHIDDASTLLCSQMDNMEKPFVPGCGGYVYGDGSVSSPNYLSNNNNNFDECFWFPEARQSDGVIFVKRNSAPTVRSLPFTVLSTLPSELPIMTVYDGWNSSGQVLYDELDSSKPAQAKSVVYSVSQKMMIRFTRPKVSCSSRNWSVTTVYDGPTVNSPLLLEKSGLSSTPFAVNSSSNEMLVRFTSDENITLPGFLAVYSTV